MNKKIAIPTTNDVLSAHFGHCEKFAIFTVTDSKITHNEIVPLPEDGNKPYAQYLRELGCDVIIAGGMGNKALAICLEHKLDIYMGEPELPLTELVTKYVNTELNPGVKPCDHNCNE